MPLHTESLIQSELLLGRYVFLSASIPESARWKGNYDPYEITDAVVAAVRAVFTASGRLVCAVHPTIAPLLLNVANAFPPLPGQEPLTRIYQSEYFSAQLVAETRQLERRPDLGEIIWTPAATAVLEDERREGSLRIMRRRMLEDGKPAAAIFVGGMEGIRSEFDLFRRLYPKRPVYPLARPGGAAAELVREIDSPLSSDLASGDVYPILMDNVVADIARSLDSSPDSSELRG